MRSRRDCWRRRGASAGSRTIPWPNPRIEYVETGERNAGRANTSLVEPGFGLPCISDLMGDWYNRNSILECGLPSMRRLTASESEGCAGPCDSPSCVWRNAATVEHDSKRYAWAKAKGDIDVAIEKTRRINQIGGVVRKGQILVQPPLTPEGILRNPPTKYAI